MPLILWIFQAFIKRLNDKMVGDYAAIDDAKQLLEKDFLKLSAIQSSSVEEVLTLPLRVSRQALSWLVCIIIISFRLEFIRWFGYFFSASSRLLLLRGTPDTAQIMCHYTLYKFYMDCFIHCP